MIGGVLRLHKNSFEKLRRRTPEALRLKNRFFVYLSLA